MNHSQIMQSAHAAARKMITTQKAQKHPSAWVSYKAAFAICLSGAYIVAKRQPVAVKLGIVEPRRHGWQDRNAYSFGNYQQGEA